MPELARMTEDELARAYAAARWGATRDSGRECEVLAEAFRRATDERCMMPALMWGPHAKRARSAARARRKAARA